MSLPLQEAARIGQLQTVTQLLAAGADVNAADASGRAPLYEAAVAGHTEVVQVLLAAGADVDAEDVHGWTPLSAAAFHQWPEVVQLLAAAGADVDAPNINNWTTLHFAAARGHREMVQLLLRIGANPQMRNAFGETALHAAAEFGHTMCETTLKGIVQLLLEAWGKPQISAADLTAAAQGAARVTHADGQHMATLAQLAKELQRLYPAELHQLFEGQHPCTIFPALALAAALKEWASDVSSLDEQRAAVRKREEDVASEKAAVQQLVVAVADMARSAQQHHA